MTAQGRFGIIAAERLLYLILNCHNQFAASRQRLMAQYQRAPRFWYSSRRAAIILDSKLPQPVCRFAPTVDGTIPNALRAFGIVAAKRLLYLILNCHNQFAASRQRLMAQYQRASRFWYSSRKAAIILDSKLPQPVRRFAPTVDGTIPTRSALLV